MSAGNARSWKPRYKVGQIRPSQMLYAFGIGSIVDLPKISAVVMGIDEWETEEARSIEEPRLLEAVREELGPQVQRLLTPPRPPESKPGLHSPFGQTPVGAPVGTFPRWLLCPLCRLLAPLSSDLFELKANRFRPDSTSYVHVNCPKAGGKASLPAVPSRFLVACKRGHLDDFPWISFVHGGPTDCTGALRMLEFGVSGEAAAIQVRCDCGNTKSLARAFDPEGKRAMPMCRGRRPHLRDFDPSGCEERVETLLLGASNAWFPLTLSALAIPSGESGLTGLVDRNWDSLQHASSPAILAAFRAIGRLPGFEEYSDDEVWEALEAQRSGTPAEVERNANLRDPEWKVLSQPDSVPSTDDFWLRRVAVPEGLGEQIEQVVLGERLREVQAFVGFTRVESAADWAFNEQIEDNRRAPISRKASTWVPAAEVRGEGIFIQFCEGVLSQWERSMPVMLRGSDFREAHSKFRSARHLEDTDASFPGMRYVLLHSFSHALIRQLALECGYGVASMKERLYARTGGEGGDAMSGVLIYTSAPDSEGTLGGLVRLGEPAGLRRHIEQALEMVQLCASDPLCAEHDVKVGVATLHGAACHACLFLPETSCERGNRYLDRTTLVPTFTASDLAFFPESR